MNYIKEMNALYDRQEQTPISGAGIALWSALMNINNKTRWKNTFTSPGTVLRAKAGLTESSFKRARAELVEVGYIEVESQGRGKAPIYTMHSLIVEADEKQENRVASVLEEEVAMPEHVVTSSNEVTNRPPVQPMIQKVALIPSQQVAREKGQVADHYPTEQVHQEVTHVPDHLATHLPDHDPAPLVKQYITKQKQTKLNTAAADSRESVSLENKNKQNPQMSDAIMFYQENIGMTSPFVADSLMDWIQELGEELVIEAMKRALERNKTSWAYVKSILNDWQKKGIRTVEQAQREQVTFENERKQQRGDRFFAVTENIVPDWYDAEKERQRKKWERKEWKDPEEENRKRKRVEEMLREFSS